MIGMVLIGTVAGAHIQDCRERCDVPTLADLYLEKTEELVKDQGILGKRLMPRFREEIRSVENFTDSAISLEQGLES